MEGDWGSITGGTHFSRIRCPERLGASPAPHPMEPLLKQPVCEQTSHRNEELMIMREIAPATH